MSTLHASKTYVDGKISAIDAEHKELLQGKQDKLVVGAGITMDGDGKTISFMYDFPQLSNRVVLNEQAIQGKQDKLTAGDNIIIANGVISSTGGSVEEIEEARDEAIDAIATQVAQAQTSANQASASASEAKEARDEVIAIVGDVGDINALLETI